MLAMHKNSFDHEQVPPYLHSNSSYESAVDYLSQHVVDVFEDDVLLGRGKSNVKHPGNLRFQAMITYNRRRYFGGATPQEKKEITEEIVDSIYQKGRFLKKHAVTKAWIEITVQAARTKVAQALQYRQRRAVRDGDEITRPPTPKTPQVPPETRRHRTRKAEYNRQNEKGSGTSNAARLFLERQAEPRSKSSSTFPSHIQNQQSLLPEITHQDSTSRFVSNGDIRWALGMQANANQGRDHSVLDFTGTGFGTPAAAAAGHSFQQTHSQQTELGSALMRRYSALGSASALDSRRLQPAVQDIDPFGLSNRKPSAEMITSFGVPPQSVDIGVPYPLQQNLLRQKQQQEKQQHQVHVQQPRMSCSGDPIEDSVTATSFSNANVSLPDMNSYFLQQQQQYAQESPPLSSLPPPPAASSLRPSLVAPSGYASFATDDEVFQQAFIGANSPGSSIPPWNTNPDDP